MGHYGSHWRRFLGYLWSVTTTTTTIKRMRDEWTRAAGGSTTRVARLVAIAVSRQPWAARARGLPKVERA